MEVVNNYKPAVLEFTAESNEVPKSLGEFKTEKEARQFIAENTVSINSSVLAERMLDEVEIKDIREKYINELENNLPAYREGHIQSLNELDVAKEQEKRAKEMVSASLNKVQELANLSKEGKTTIELDKTNTWEIPYNNRNYYYSYVNGELILVKVSEIPLHKQPDLMSSSEQNAMLFDSLLEASNG